MPYPTERDREVAREITMAFGFASRETERQITDMIAAALAEEREACARVCDALATYAGEDAWTKCPVALCAHQIRARGEEA